MSSPSFNGNCSSGNFVLFCDIYAIENIEFPPIFNLSCNENNIIKGITIKYGENKKDEILCPINQGLSAIDEKSYKCCFYNFMM